MSEYDRARTLARLLHGDQKDKAGIPVYLHAVRVASTVEPDTGAADAATVAFLHDVVEDTEATLDDLRALGFAEATVEAVDALTRRPGETYADYIERAALNATALAVKVADLRDHLRAEARVHIMNSLAARYERALERLTGRTS